MATTVTAAEWRNQQRRATPTRADDTARLADGTKATPAAVQELVDAANARHAARRG